MGKLFTSVVNSSLYEFVRKYKIVGAEQGEFKNRPFNNISHFHFKIFCICIGIKIYIVAS